MSAKEWIEEFERYLLLVKNRAAMTASSYVTDVELLQKFLKVDDWAAVTEDMAVNYMAHLRKTSADSSVSRKLYALRGFFRFLRRKGVVKVDPFGDVEFRAVRSTLPDTLTVNEMNKLLNRIREPLQAALGVPSIYTFLTIRDRSMLELLYSSGLRVSELCGLDWSAIDWAKREVTVLGKGKKMRVCPVGQTALEALLEYMPHYEGHWKTKAEGAAPIFLSSWNMRINTRTIPRTIRKWCRLAGVRVVNPHAFRHSCATHMLAGGADIRVIQKLLGHASIATTQIYTAVELKQVKTTHSNTHPRA